ncbi:MAG: phosphotransferase family protein, partial [Acidimicrobiia bacterium]
AFDSPRLLGHDPERGMTLWSYLAGRSLDELASSRSPEVLQAAAAAGEAVKALHTGPIPSGLPARDGAAEAAWVEVWVERLAALAPFLGGQARVTLPRVRERLARSAEPAALVHADLHDRQVMLDGGRVGILDWDTVAVGEPALDLANLLVHMEVRAMLGGRRAADAGPAGAAVMTGYGAAHPGRIVDYAAAIRLRVACQYRFRPPAAHICDLLINRLTEPPAGLVGSRG